jgi:hypothetical protein
MAIKTSWQKPKNKYMDQHIRIERKEKNSMHLDVKQSARICSKCANNIQ